MFKSSGLCFATEIRNDRYFPGLFIGQLGLDIEKTNRFDLISEKIYPDRLFFCKRIHIHNTPPDRKLSRFIDKIIPFEPVFYQKIFDERNR